MLVGGGLSSVPRIARELGVFVRPDEAIAALRAILDTWCDDLRWRVSRVVVEDEGAVGLRGAGGVGDHRQRIILDVDELEGVLGNVATRLLLENDRVRIWELDLEPGARSDTHRHDLDYVLVQIDGDRIAAAPEPDSAGAYRDYIEAEVMPGKARFIARGGIETAINVGTRRYREILIELK